MRSIFGEQQLPPSAEMAVIVSARVAVVHVPIMVALPSGSELCVVGFWCDSPSQLTPKLTPKKVVSFSICTPGRKPPGYVTERALWPSRGKGVKENDQHINLLHDDHVLSNTGVTN
jgi:hypothetical protein